VVSVSAGAAKAGWLRTPESLGWDKSPNSDEL
jgi:hypothetical protein